MKDDSPSDLRHAPCRATEVLYKYRLAADQRRRVSHRHTEKTSQHLLTMGNMKAFFILCTYVLLGVAQCNHVCKTCWVKDDTECCHEKETDCGQGSQCMSESEHCILNGTEFVAYRMTCAIPPLCGTCFIASTIEEPSLLRVGYECSSDDGSSLKFNRQCAEQPAENGLRCPNCYDGSNSSACKGKSKKYVKCRGNQLECFHYGGDILFSDGSLKSISARGCITKGACTVGFTVVPGATEIKRNVFTCSEAKKV